MNRIKKANTLRSIVLTLAFTFAIVFFISFSTNSANAATSKPGQVTSLTCAKKTTTSIKIEWKKASNASKYQIAYKKKGNSTYTTTTTANTYRTISKLKSGTYYNFKVRGYKFVKGERVYGKWSSVKTFKTRSKTVAKKSNSDNNNSSSDTGSGVSVYITASGTKYHRYSGCRGLKNANGLTVVSLSYAQSHGYSLCGWE